jgi:ABC-2 type transport system permease protein
MLPPEVRVLLKKEWRQLRRSRGALATALLLPTLLLLIIPGAMMFGVLAEGSTDQVRLPEGVPLPPGLAAIGDDPTAMLRVLLLPLFVTISGLIVPSMTAMYTIITERENRTLELLVALPVRVGQILLAKLLVILMLAAVVMLVLFSANAILIITLDVASVGYVLMLLLLLFSALAYSTASALLLGLLARDYRTANNINGILFGPTIFLTMILLMSVAGATLALAILAGMFALAAAIVLAIALRVVTFERLLS